MSIINTPSFGMTAPDPPDNEALASIEANIMKNMTDFTMPQTNRPHTTASTHFTNSLPFIVLNRFVFG